ncbi:MAG: phage tail tube protein [Syntrophobacteraceae bacterium]
MAVDHLLRKGVVVVKQEANYGVDSLPTSTNVVLCSIPQHAVSGEKYVRDFMRNTLMSQGFSVGAKKQTISFSCEFKGPNNVGAPETPTYLSDLLEACGLVETEGTMGADEALVYTPTSTQSLMKSCTIYYYLDGIKHALVGCRGNVTFEFPVNGVPKANFAMTGFYVAPTDSANPALGAIPDYEAPPCVNIGFVIGAYSPTGLEKVTIDLGNKIAEKKDLNSATGLSSILIVEREVKIGVDCDVDTLAAFNPYTLWANGALQTLSFTIGAKGNRVHATTSYGRLDEPTKSDKDGRAVYNLNFVVTGDDNNFVLKTG